MVEKPTHLEAVPEGGPSFQEMAEETDLAVFTMMTDLRGAHPGLGGAILVGTVGGLTRFQLQALPEGSAGRQVLETLAPTIIKTGDQIAQAQRERLGKPKPKVVPVAPLQTAFERLQEVLAGAPFPTYCIRQADNRLLLISSMVARDGVLTHGSIANLEGAIHRADEVVHAHCRAAAIRWKSETDLVETIRARADSLREEAKERPHLEDEPLTEARALDWVLRLIENPEGETHVGQA